MNKFRVLTTVTVAAGLLAASAASATTKDFTFSDLGATVASGSFSYAPGDTGVLGFDDLTSFSLTVAGAAYDLAEVDTLSNYVWFAYDTSANDFVANPSSCGFDGCGYASTLSAIDGSGHFGFFFNPVSSQGAEFEEYTTQTIGSIDAVAITNGGVPEPASWSLMILGIGGVGLSLRRAKRPASQFAA